jgi:hypothetical protein
MHTLYTLADRQTTKKANPNELTFRAANSVEVLRSSSAAAAKINRLARLARNHLSAYISQLFLAV